MNSRNTVTAQDARSVEFMLADGMSPKEIKKALDTVGRIFHLATIYRMIEKIRSGVPPEELIRVKSGRGRKFQGGVSKEQLLEAIEAQVTKNHRGSTVSNMAMQFGVARSTISRSMKLLANPKKSVKTVRCQAYTPATMRKRISKSQELLAWMKAAGTDCSERIFFTDECVFKLGPIISGNCNSRVWIDSSSNKAETPPNLILRATKSREAGLMVSVAVSALGGGFASVPHIIPVKQMINAD